jgi:hypothetical protein
MRDTYSMVECEFINSCPFFKGELAGKDVDIEKIKNDYCRTNNLHCARYIVAITLGKEHMPENLYPHEKDKAYKMIAEND